MPRDFPSASYDAWKTRSDDDELARLLEPEPESEQEEEMSNEITTHNPNPVAIAEAEALIKAAASDEGRSMRLLKHKKGHYFIRDEEIPLGKEYIAHCVGWAKEWVRFEAGQPTARLTYRMIDGKQPPERDEIPAELERRGIDILAMDEQEISQWPPGLNGPHSDPWSLQFMLPLQDKDTDEVVVFVTSAEWGKPAVAALCAVYGRRKKRLFDCGQPIIKIGTAERTGRYGKNFAPTFEIVGWDDADHDVVRSVSIEQDNELNDEIPY
jgi:hypothetical protein